MLIVDSDDGVRACLATGLADDGFSVRAATCVGHAKELLSQRLPDVVLCDRRLIDGDFRTLTRLEAIQAASLPFLVTLAEPDRELIEAAYAEPVVQHVLRKPFTASECAAHLLNAVRRSRVEMMPLGSLRLDRRRQRIVDSRGSVHFLRPQECALLETLAANPGTPVSRDRLLAAVADSFEGPKSNVVDVLVYRLRGLPGLGPRLRTVRGVGYMFA